MFPGVYSSPVCLVLEATNRARTPGKDWISAKYIKYQSVPVDPQNGTYSFIANLPYDCLYLFGRNQGALYPLFLEGGDEITADFSNYDMYLSGQDLSYENKILLEWENGVNDVKVEAFMGKSLPGASTSAPFLLSNRKSNRLKEIGCSS